MIQRTSPITPFRWMPRMLELALCSVLAACAVAEESAPADPEPAPAPPAAETPAADGPTTVIVKNDGTRVAGEIVEEEFEFIILKLPSGEQVTIDTDDIQHIEYPDPEESAPAKPAPGDSGGDPGRGVDSAKPKGPAAKLTHEKEWPRPAATPLELKVWALGPRVRWDENKAAAAELAAIKDPGYVELFKELLTFDCTKVPLDEDMPTNLWRETLATSVATSGEPGTEEYAWKMADSRDPRERYIGANILRHFKSKKNAKILHEIFASAVIPISQIRRPRWQDIMIANEEQFAEVMQHVDQIYEEQEGLGGITEDALRDMGLVGLEGVAASIGSLRGEEKRASIYLVARLGLITQEDRTKYGYSDDDVNAIGLEAAKILVPPLGIDRDFLVDYFFAIQKVGEPTWLPLIEALRNPQQKDWAVLSLRRNTPEKTMPATYDRWREWYKLRFGR